MRISKTIIWSWLFIGALHGGVSFADPGGSTFVAWGPARDGLQAGVSVRENKRAFRPGELLTLQVHVRNTGTQARSLTYFMGILDDFEPKLEDVVGKKIPVVMPPFELNKRQNVDESVKPGQTVEVGTVKMVFRERVEDDPVNLPTIRAGAGTYRLSYSAFAVSDRALTTGKLELEIRRGR